MLSHMLAHVLEIKAASESEPPSVARGNCNIFSYNVDLNSMGHHWYQFRGTALKMAADRGAVPLVQLLLDAGADPDIAGKIPVKKVCAKAHLLSVKE